jgi:hypothetical protein
MLCNGHSIYGPIFKARRHLSRNITLYVVCNFYGLISKHLFNCNRLLPCDPAAPQAVISHDLWKACLTLRSGKLPTIMFKSLVYYTLWTGPTSHWTLGLQSSSTRCNITPREHYLLNYLEEPGRAHRAKRVKLFCEGILVPPITLLLHSLYQTSRFRLVLLQGCTVLCNCAVYQPFFACLGGQL